MAKSPGISGNGHINPINITFKKPFKQVPKVKIFLYDDTVCNWFSYDVDDLTYKWYEYDFSDMITITETGFSIPPFNCETLEFSAGAMAGLFDFECQDESGNTVVVTNPTKWKYVAYIE